MSVSVLGHSYTSLLLVLPMDLESEKKKIISAITEKMDRVYRNTKKKNNKNGDYLLKMVIPILIRKKFSNVVKT